MLLRDTYSYAVPPTVQELSLNIGGAEPHSASIGGYLVYADAASSVRISLQVLVTREVAAVLLCNKAYSRSHKPLNSWWVCPTVISSVMTLLGWATIH